MIEIILRRVDDGIRITSPAAMLERLGIGGGDRLFAVETERGILLTPRHPLDLVAMEAFSEVRSSYANVLRRLAD